MGTLVVILCVLIFLICVVFEELVNTYRENEEDEDYDP